MIKKIPDEIIEKRAVMMMIFLFIFLKYFLNLILKLNWAQRVNRKLKLKKEKRKRIIHKALNCRFVQTWAGAFR